MNDKLRKQLIAHATSFEFLVEDEKIFLYKEESGRWTVNYEQQILTKEGKWIINKKPSKRSKKFKEQVEMCLEDAYSRILVTKI